MKKLMFGLAALAAGSVMAIESANVVGYQQLEIKPGLNLVGTSFLKCDGTGRPDIQATFADAKGKALTGEADGEADFIQVFDSVTKGYPNSFFFYAPHDPADADPDYDYKWLDGDMEPATFVIPTANAFWYKSRGNEAFTLTSSGMVGGESVEVTIKPGLNLIVNPFPCALELNSVSVNWKDAGAKTGEADGEADFIQVFDTTTKGYPNSFFFYAPHDPADADADYDYKWLDGDMEPTSFAIPAGAGFWYKSRGTQDITITFKTPLAK